MRGPIPTASDPDVHVANGMAPLELSSKRINEDGLEKLESPTTSSWTSIGQDSAAMESEFMDGASQMALAKNDDDENDLGGPCGLGRCQPKCLQRFRTARWVLVCLCWAGALQGMVVNGFVNVVITTIERRFDLRSTETGLIAGAYDIASFICLIPVSYFGGMGCKPRWLGLGVLLIGVGSFVFTIPHFTSGLYTFNIENENLCQYGNESNISSTACVGKTTKMSQYKYVFILGQMLHGVGAAPLYTLGVAFLDESVSTKMSSVYIGIYYAMAVIGPAIGYLLGGQFLKIYTDVGSKDPSELGLNPSSNVWVGAWWIGFLLSGILSLLVAIPILAFPKILPGAKRIQAEKISEAHKGTDDTAQIGFHTSLKELPRSLRILLCNPCFMFLNLAGACEALLLNGFAAFLPKYIESQFSVVASWAALLVGVVTVPAGGGGTFLGGYLVKRFRLRCSGIIRMCIFFTLCALSLTLVFLINCPNIPFAGVNTSYIPNNLSAVLGENCSAMCNCQEDRYDPVCGVDNVMYYSPCVAGCEVMHQEEHNKWYSNCSCINASGKKIKINGRVETITATGDVCESSCHLLPTFLGISFFLMLFTFLTSMPALSATLRCVPSAQRSLSLGIQWLIVRLLGSIPAPIFFGALMDSTCVLWQDFCGEQGSCRSYSNPKMSRIMLIVAIIGKGVSALSFFCAWILYKAPVTVLPSSASSISSDKKLQKISVIMDSNKDDQVYAIDHVSYNGKTSSS